MARPPQPRPPVEQPVGKPIRYIALTRHMLSVVDEWNFEKLNARTWRADKRPTAHGRKFVARSNFGLMHRIILGISDPKIEVDHRNGDPLDNREENLRLATHAQNNMNVGVKTSRTGYKGVEITRSGRYSARIRENNRRHFLGTFSDPISAAKAYDTAARVLHGEFARTNFSEEEGE